MFNNMERSAMPSERFEIIEVKQHLDEWRSKQGPYPREFADGDPIPNRSL